MKAAVISGIGEHEEITYREVANPTPKENEVLIKMLYCGVNHLDVLIKEGKRPGPTIFPHVLGSEILGIVAQDSKQFKKGTIVAIYPWTFCGRCKMCQEGSEQICDTGGTIGRTAWGGYAELVCVPEKNILPVLENVHQEHVCAAILTGTTAIHLLERAGIKNNSTVLVTGATGGVGTIVLQLLKEKKCMTIAATSHPDKQTQLEKLGADHIVNTKNLVLDIKRIAPSGVEYVIDIVGGTIWSQAVATLGKHGTMVFCSTSRAETGQVHIGTSFFKEITIRGSYGGSRKNMEEIIEKVQKGIISPVVDAVFPLDETAKAHEKIEHQKVFGKILLHP
ncbi:MAG: alcohol dehydrogenase catalytic domain-containing protein [Candidatus Levybacteria bacterium]|nr:alcohol dehydrogenase catalytic domain-containing protein [Candidatus Levybacteria bacterium]